MKVSHIGLGIFFLVCSTWAGTFMETFEGRNLEDWLELNVHDAAPGTWEILEGELQGINQGGAARLLITGNETWHDYSIQVYVTKANRESARFLNLKPFKPVPTQPSVPHEL